MDYLISRKHYLLLFLVIALYFLNLGTNQVFAPNESFYADAALNMLKTGNYLIPIYNDHIRLAKPPLLYWLIALSFKIFGVSSFSLRLPSALAGSFCVLFTYYFGEKITKNLGLYGAIATGMALEFVSNARYASPEVLFCFFISSSIYFLYFYLKSQKIYYLVASTILSSLAMLTKGPVGVLIVGFVGFWYIVFENPNLLKDYKLYMAFVIALFIGGLWYIEVLNSPYKELLIHKFYIENIKRINGLESDPWYFYIKDTIVSFAPFSIVLYLFFLNLKGLKTIKLASVWFFSLFIVFSLIKMKIPTYLIPAYPAMGFIVGINALAKKYFRYMFWILFCIGLLIYYALIVFVLPSIEPYRPYKEMGYVIRLYKNNKPVYYEGYFIHQLPFYADTTIKKFAKNSKPGILITETQCKKPLWEGYVYTDSESRFLVFLKDIYKFKKGDIKDSKFKKFYICNYKGPNKMGP